MTNMPSIETTGNVLECCGQIFFSPGDLKAHKAVAHAEQVRAAVVKAEPVPKAVVIKTPITLTYQYTGNCDCGAVVETLILDDPHKTSNQAVIAWCPSCKKQLQTKTVGKIK